MDKRRLREAFWNKRSDANFRGIEFLLTFEEWLEIWEASGHLHERGRKRGQYVMARYGDKGPYAVGNVKIITAGENVAEVRQGKKFGPCLVPKPRPGAPRAKLTDASVYALQPIPGKQYAVYDSICLRLHIRVSYGGTKSWYATFYVDGKPRWKKVGRFPHMSIEQARQAVSRPL